jgi:excisionase family DNA binding protein
MVAEDELLTVPEIALRLKVREETVREWLRKNEIHGYNFGGRTGWRIPASEIGALLSARSGKRSTSASFTDATTRRGEGSMPSPSSLLEQDH